MTASGVALALAKDLCHSTLSDLSGAVRKHLLGSSLLAVLMAVGVGCYVAFVSVSLRWAPPHEPARAAIHGRYAGPLAAGRASHQRQRDRDQGGNRALAAGAPRGPGGHDSSLGGPGPRRASPRTQVPAVTPLPTLTPSPSPAPAPSLARSPRRSQSPVPTVSSTVLCVFGICI